MSENHLCLSSKQSGRHDDSPLQASGHEAKGSGSDLAAVGTKERRLPKYETVRSPRRTAQMHQPNFVDPLVTVAISCATERQVQNRSRASRELATRVDNRFDHDSLKWFIAQIGGLNLGGIADGLGITLGNKATKVEHKNIAAQT